MTITCAGELCQFWMRQHKRPPRQTAQKQKKPHVLQVISSYMVLTLVAIETLVVYNVANYDAVMEFFQGHQQARQRRAEMYRQARKAAGLGEPPRRWTVPCERR